MSYKLKLDIFEGPLDLLLYLIKKNDIEISDIPIVDVTEQYMQYIEMMKMLDLDIVGDFLVMAATLMQIKSKMLLPPDPSEEEENEEDPRSELARRLLEYKRFKEIANDLENKELVRKDFMPRAIDESETRQFIEDGKEVYYEASLFDLINALSEALKKVPEKVLHEIVKEEFTVEQKIHDILHRVLDHEHVMLTQVFSECRSKMEAVVTFLAVLELIRLKEIKIVQKKLFSDIEIIRNKENIIPPEASSDDVQEEEQVESSSEEQPEEEDESAPEEEPST